MKHRIVLAVLLVLLGLGIISCGKTGNIYEGTIDNTDLINYGDFSLNAESIGLSSTVRGTIFVRGDIDDPSDRHILISAQLEIDPDDMGGVAFGLEEGSGWKFTGVTSDYPQGFSSPEQDANLWTSGDRAQVWIGMRLYGHGSGHPGGTGTVIIELEPIPGTKALPEEFSIVVGIGAQTDLKFSDNPAETTTTTSSTTTTNTAGGTTTVTVLPGDTYNSVHPVHETITVPINVDYRETAD